MAITSLRRGSWPANTAYAEAGAITQGGSAKTTTVVMSQMQGVITMDDDNLAAATEVVFTVTNTLVEVTDTIALSIQSGGTAGEYMAQVVTVANGSFIVALTNLSGSTAGDAVIINFAVIRGDQ